MSTPKSATPRNHAYRVAGCGLAVFAAVGLFATAPASAHFELQTPASWMSQDTLGLPEKAPPCGDEGGGTVTGTITALHPGEKVTVTINELIFHPGHYRIALATDRSLLPAEPPVTAGTTACGSVPIETSPTFPVLADGLFVHTTPFSGPQTTTVTLPTNITCTKCTLQVIEFMSDHPLNNPGGCFYHHCADISIQAGADLDGSAGAGGGVDAAGGSGGSSGGGSGGGSSSGAGGSSGSGSGSGSGGGTGSGSGGSGSGSGGTGGADASSSATGGGPTGSSGGCSFAVPTSGTPIASGLAGLLALALVRVRRRRSKSAGR